MAFTGNYMTTSFKLDLLNGKQAFGTTVVRASTTADSYKMALYTSSATLNASTTVYTSSDETTNSAGTAYVAGGLLLTGATSTSSGTTAFCDFADAAWPSATFTARGALIYNQTQANSSVVVLDFGSDKSAVANTFTVLFPTNDASNAIIRIA
ncbi:MAG: hypothetical protein FJ211_10155 [Ignavibacteria bacterium]|nr:hypothetical protein [Ignavibacteria bacterium]